MQSNYLQDVRYKLQKRVRRLNQADGTQFLFALKQFWVFFDSYPILVSTRDELLAKFPEVASDISKIGGGQMLFGNNEAESAAIGCEVLKRFAEQDNPDEYYRFVPPVMGQGSMLDGFRQLYLDPFYEHFDENLDDRNFVLFCLERYKRTCEWFERERLFQSWENDTQRGEKRLALDLYKYLFGHGVEFHIEPSSVSGEADMVAAQSSENPLIADVKVFNPSKGKAKAYMIRALQQVHTYACDYNQPVGYLIIFNTSSVQLRFALANPDHPAPRVLLNNKTIFLVVIDIFPHTESASQRKSPDSVEITDQDFIAANASPQPAVES